MSMHAYTHTPISVSRSFPAETRLILLQMQTRLPQTTGVDCPSLLGAKVLSCWESNTHLEVMNPCALNCLASDTNKKPE